MATKFYRLGEYTPSHRLPRNVVVDADIQQDIDFDNVGLADEYCDRVSDTYGFCIESCNVNYNNGRVEITGIKWDTTD